MAYKVVFTSTFNKKLSDAVEYRLVYQGQTSASRLLEALDSQCSKLALFPRMGTSIELDGQHHQENLRWTLIQRCVLVYQIADGDDTVFFQDLFHSGEDWKSKLGVRENETASDEE